MVLLSPARMVSGVKEKFSMVPVFVVGTWIVNVEEAGAEVVLPSDARASTVYVMPSRHGAEFVANVHEVVPVAGSHAGIVAKVVPLVCR